ncbi:MAG TPA: hypothetical protein PKX40_02615 [Spirochaetota bacterium]|nr:hypothetical protein [Spirochaetota bacterium]
MIRCYKNFRIYLGHSDLNALGLVNSYYVNMTDETLVYNHTMTVPAGLKAGDWVDIPLDIAFDYDPGSNVGIYILHDAGSGGIENFVHAEQDAYEYPSRLLGMENQSSSLPGWKADISYSIRLGME